jgi:hypothetical protein
MQCLKNSVLSLTIAVLLLSSTTASQIQEPLLTPRPEQQQGPSKPARKFVKAKNPIANRFIVVLNDDVVSGLDMIIRINMTVCAKRPSFLLMKSSPGYLRFPGLAQHPLD